MSRPKKYDVCLSFAGEDRPYVKRVADALASKGIRVFYDEYEKVQLWGKDLYAHLDDIYQNSARYCVIFLSKSYAKKVWTNHERQSAQARAIKAHAEYVLPARFDSTKIAGIRDTIGYVDLKKTSPEQLSQMIVQKIGPRQRNDFFPPVPDRLFDRMKAKSSKAKIATRTAANSFFEALQRMNTTERRIVFEVFIQGCPMELPDNVHISLDLLRRTLRTSVTRIVRIISGLESLGVMSTVREGHGPGDTDLILEVEWHDMHLANSGNFTAVASAMIQLAVDKYCKVHGWQMLENLDFGQLASATTIVDAH